MLCVKNKVPSNEAKFITVPNPTDEHCMNVYGIIADSCLFKHNLCAMRLIGAAIVIADLFIIIGCLIYGVSTGNHKVSVVSAIVVWILFIVQKILFKLLDKDYKKYHDMLDKCYKEVINEIKKDDKDVE